MKVITSTSAIAALGLVFLGFGVYSGDPRQLGFGVVWLLIASAKHILISGKPKVNRPN